MEGLRHRELVQQLLSNSVKKAPLLNRFNRTLKSPSGHTSLRNENRTAATCYHNSWRPKTTIARTPSAKLPTKSPRRTRPRSGCLHGDGDNEERRQRHNLSCQEWADCEDKLGKSAFDKGYMPNWSDYFMVESDKSNERRALNLTEERLSEHRGNWYAKEMQEIS